MLGTVIGSLLFRTNLVLMVTDIAFILIVFLVQKTGERLIDRAAVKKPAKVSGKQTRYIGTAMLTAAVLIFACGIALQKNQIAAGSIGQPQSQKAAMDEENDLQLATIEINASGFSPKNTELRSGSMVKAIVNVKSNAGTGLKLVSKELNLSADLKAGQNMFLINNPQPGIYELILEPKHLKSTLTVKAGSK
ncbi:cupredoxin domain-containing protein [Paenibacillus filicis]|uniref:Cupredoxin domain-containing protein n=1 Tax=Paenibacillus gyeongsangnamensis TaxID=3388067 RepID=A0ABT4QJR0_9BACL|nr:cupredoxin domain-containing protein [Paenibacillus filicis]MCZ8517111.1 cupredoxin domain-containing protein [Paenibacillus filicis]